MSHDRIKSTRMHQIRIMQWDKAVPHTKHTSLTLLSVIDFLDIKTSIILSCQGDRCSGTNHWGLVGIPPWEHIETHIQHNKAPGTAGWVQVLCMVSATTICCLTVVLLCAILVADSFLLLVRTTEMQFLFQYASADSSLGSCC